jgi:hypothetical protein
VEPLRFAGGREGAEETRVARGRFEPGAPDWVYLPVEVPAGVRELSVAYDYDRPAPPQGMPGNALDIGIFDPGGHALGDVAGFRGWSGGARDGFVIGPAGATPGYLPGPIHQGIWRVLLGPYTVAPQGLEWTVRVTLRYGEPGPAFLPRAAPDRARGRGPAWYRGDAHLHTVHSDGQRLPEEVLAAARAAGLDFIVSTEHNTSSASVVWGGHLGAGSDLLVIDGEEVTTRNGHLLVLGLPAGAWLDWRYRAADGAIGRILRQARGLGALPVAAHPYCPFPGCAWKFGYDGLDAVEVWNGPWTLDDEAALATWDGIVAARGQGGWPVAVGGSDAHREPEVVGLPRNVVLADDLERGAILEGMRAGHVWLAESGALDLSFRASADGRSAGIGERLAVEPGASVSLRLEVAGAGGCVARLCTDLGTVGEAPVGGDDRAVVTWTTTARASSHVRAEVRRPGPAPTTAGSMVALTNPIFLGLSAPPERGSGRGPPGDGGDPAG